MQYHILVLLSQESVKSGKLKYSNNHLINKIYVFYSQSYFYNYVIKDTKQFIRATLYNGSKK